MGIFEKRINYKPFEYNEITEPFIFAMWASHWTHREYNFKSDIQDFKTKVTEEEQGVLKRALLMISQLEIAIKAYWCNIGKIFPKPEIADMGAVFGGVEVIHARAYAEILDKLDLNDEYLKMLNDSVVKNRVKYLNKYVDKVYTNDKQNKMYSLVLFILFTEATSLFSQFFVILGFNRFNGIFKDIANIVQYTSKEENLHMEGGIALINKVREEEPELFDEKFINKIYEETKEAFLSEREIIKWILQDYENDFLSEEILEKYLKYRFNECLHKIGINKPFKLKQEDIDKFIWMEEEILIPAQTDFFHKKAIDYVKSTKPSSSKDLF